jgi:hypothetical protein
MGILLLLLNLSIYYTPRYEQERTSTLFHSHSCHCGNQLEERVEFSSKHTQYGPCILLALSL